MMVNLFCASDLGGGAKVFDPVGRLQARGVTEYMSRCYVPVIGIQKTGKRNQITGTFDTGGRAGPGRVGSPRSADTVPVLANHSLVLTNVTTVISATTFADCPSMLIPWLILFSESDDNTSLRL